MSRLLEFVFYRLLKWEILGEFPESEKQYVIIAAPHTSWLDFPLGLLVRSIKKKNIYFVGKKSLFRKPYGTLFRWLGGFPIDRSKSNNTVEFLKQKFKENPNFILAMSPEGTRQKVKNWKTGFYYVAKGAGVPVVKVALDFKNRKILIDQPFFLTKNIESDLKTIRQFFNGISGRFHNLS